MGEVIYQAEGVSPMPPIFEFCEPTALAAGIEALFVQGKLFRPMSMEWATSPRRWFATIGIGTLTVTSIPLSSIARG